MKHLHLKTGDEVIVVAGADKGKRGKLTQVFPKMNRVVVEGVRVCKRHLRSRKTGTAGQIVEFSMPIHASNVQLIGMDGKPLRHTKRPTQK
ncbi:MAG: 50S ribosomal protein L24 [Patescibacteria group bacterium]